MFAITSVSQRDMENNEILMIFFIVLGTFLFILRLPTSFVHDIIIILLCGTNNLRLLLWPRDERPIIREMNNEWTSSVTEIKESNFPI